MAYILGSGAQVLVSLPGAARSGFLRPFKVGPRLLVYCMVRGITKGKRIIIYKWPD